MATTTNYSWSTPDDTALVKDGAAAIRTLGSSADTTVKALNPGTTAGDLDYYTTSTTKARLAIGTANQQLRVNSGATAPEWFTPAAAGGLTLISTTSLSGATTTISSIPQTYKSLYLLIYGVSNATGNGDFRCRFNGSTGFDYHLNGAGTGAVMNIAGENHLQLNGNQTDPVNSSTNNVWALFVQNYTSTTNWKAYQGHALFENSGGKTVVYGGGFSDNTAISSIVLSNSGGNLSTGTALLYGVN
jgi:hypothetical protein